MGVTRDGASLLVSSFSGDGVSARRGYLVVDDADALHAELIWKGVRHWIAGRPPLRGSYTRR